MTQAVQPIRPAATVILIREAPVSFEIFMLKRTSRASFASGMFVFPGGKVDAVMTTCISMMRTVMARPMLSLSR